MEKRQQHIEAIKRIAGALGDLNSEVVFVGGAVVGLYADKPAAEDVRPTKDVDISLDITSLGQLEQLRQKLNQKGFHQSIQDKVVCRFHYQHIQVDVMSTEEVGWAPANKWFKPGFDFLETRDIDGTTVYLLSVAFFLASKLEAFQNRGKDPRTSHDFEDIVYVLDNLLNLSADLSQSPRLVRNYLQEQFSGMIQNPVFQEAIFAHLPYDSAQQRYENVLAELRIFGTMGI